MIRKKVDSYLYLLVFFLFLVPIRTHGQETKNEKNWSFIPALHVYGATLGGNVVINNYPAVIANKKLNASWMVAFEAKSPKWSISTDFLYTKIGIDIIMPNTNREGTLDIRTSFYGLYGMRRLAKWLEIGIGGRIVVYDLIMNVPAGVIFPEIEENYKSGIVDPLFVTRFTFLDANHWELTLRGDVGAFGLFGYFTYLIYPYVGYKLNNVFEFSLGYKVINLYYNDESGNDKLDLLYYGPQLGILFRL